MTIDAEKLEVAHDPEVGRFQIEVGQWTAVLDYEWEGNAMVFTHTGVPRPLEAQGVGSRLAKTALEYAREHHHHVIPACVFMKVYIRRHPEYKELIPR
jgi:predicted GNAT family acetyltransferase